MIRASRSSPRSLLILGVAFLFLLTAVIRTGLTAPYPGANDFFQRYHGSRAFFVEGRDTYSPQVSRDAEIALYGRPYNPDPALDEFPGDFLYPFHLAVLIAPLAVLPYEWASAAWMTLTGTAAVLAFVGLSRVIGWRMRPVTLAFLIVWVITFYPLVRGILIGQPGTIITAVQLLAVIVYIRRPDNRTDELSGALLALTTVKPQISFLIIPYVLLHALITRRYRVIVAFIGTLAVLIAVSFLLLPSWFGSFLQQISGYTGYTAIGSPVWIVTHMTIPALGSTGEAILTVIFAVILLTVWVGIVRRTLSDSQVDPDLFLFGAACTLAITHWIAPRTATPQYIAYFPVLIWLFVRFRPAPRYLLMVGLSIALWLVFLNTLQGKFEHPVNYMILPLLSIPVLIAWGINVLSRRPTTGG